MEFNLNEQLERQRIEVVENIDKFQAVARRLRRLANEQGSYEGEAFEASVHALLRELSQTSRKAVARLSILITLKKGLVICEQEPESEE